MTQAYSSIDYLIIGLGKTGLSCVEFLHDKNASVVVVDTRTHPPYLSQMEQKYPQVAVSLGGIDENLLQAAKQVVLSPGVSLDSRFYKRVESLDDKMIGDIELFVQNCRAPIIAVTGSNGKSTVLTLLAEMIRATGHTVAAGGNIGTPALALLDKPIPDFYVLELSSFQLETVNSLNALTSVVLNISADHMDRYDDVNAYAAMKERIYAGTGSMVVNMDDERCQQMRCDQRKMISYSLDSDKNGDFSLVHENDNSYLYHLGEKLIATHEIALKGRHNLQNVLACLALCKAIDLDLKTTLTPLNHFTGLAHRCQELGVFNHVTWINDSKATNPGATIAAITGLGVNKKNIILIAGGDSKGADFSLLAEVFAQFVKYIVLIGEDAQQLAAVIDDSETYCYATSIAAAVDVAAQIAQAGDMVLLSPACSSLDMFADFEDRGNQFMQAVLSCHSTRQSS